MPSNQKTEAAPHGAAYLPDQKQVPRRRVLSFLSIGAFSLAPMTLLPALLRKGLTSGGRRSVAPVAFTEDGRIRQWGMVIDLRYCDGCQGIDLPPQCTAACIEGHFAAEPMEWIEVFEHELAGGGSNFIPTPCQSCQNPPCVNVCPVGATFSAPEGHVLVDQKRCIGCRMCMAACPYDRRFFNWGKPPVPKEAHHAEYSAEHQTPPMRGTVMKCDFCPDMARAGRVPHCVQGCPNNAIYYGDLEEDLATNGEEVVTFSRFLSENNVFRQKEELGTKPRVFYIPGHGEAVGRDVFQHGRRRTVWPWVEKVKGAATPWKR